VGSARPFVHLASLTLLTLSLVALLPDCASACSCAAVPGTPQEILSGSEAVFSGEVVEFEKPPPDTAMVEGTMWTIIGGGGPEATATLRVSEVWKGPRQQTIEITTEADSGVGCGYPFEEGQEYLVYATGNDHLSVSLCSETKPLSEAEADLEALGEGQKPEDVGILSDTSGGLSAPAVVGLAGMALAGSFLLAARLLRAG
jgi:Tissue inhibitor of metalloproteinase